MSVIGIYRQLTSGSDSTSLRGLFASFGSLGVDKLLGPNVTVTSHVAFVIPAGKNPHDARRVSPFRWEVFIDRAALAEFAAENAAQSRHPTLDESRSLHRWSA